MEKTKLKRGRPKGSVTKLTKDVIEKIALGISAGLTFSGAYVNAGVSKATYYKWRELGKDATGGIYKEFMDSIQEAQDKALARLEVAINKSALGGYKVIETKTITRPDGSTETAITEKVAEPDGRLMLMMLERRNPTDWAKKEKLEIFTDKPLDVHLFGDIDLGTDGFEE